MTTKQCGTCEFWDRENAVENTNLLQASTCSALVPMSVEKRAKWWMLEDEGKDCAVYKVKGE